MLAYNKTYKEFCADINQGQIVSQIQSALLRDFSESEKKSFRVSLSSVKNALSNVDIPSEAQVGLEFNVPLTNKRIDFIIAGGEFDSSRYTIFAADDDAIIPITDEEYFDDDIVTRFVEFIRTVYGNKSLESNLTYIAKALGNKGNTSREVIRNYFLNDFFKDHCSTYSVTGSGKRPIYWLFDSGKQNGFKCLIYMHRYTPDTVGLIRSVYLKKAQDAIEASLKNAEYAIANTESAVDRAANTRKRDKYVKQLAEIKPYYQALSHVAMQRIDIDLDDGVKVNYAKFQGVEVGGEGEKKQTIDLLAKI